MSMSEAKAKLLEGLKPDAVVGLEAKIAIAQRARDSSIFQACQSIYERHEAKGMLRSGVTITTVAAEVGALALSAAQAIIEACVSVGVPSDEAIARYAAADHAKVLRLALDEVAAKVGGKTGPDLLSSLIMSQAEPVAELLEQVRSLRYDHSRGQGTKLEQILRGVNDRPVLAWAIVVGLFLSWAIGVAGGLKSLWSD